MKNVVVGILPQIKLKTSDDPYDDKYEFIDLYSRKIIESGAIPFGICLNNGNLDYRSLEICDAFLIPGGNRVHRCYYEVIKYAIKKNKPLLGICLGLESLAIFSMVQEHLRMDANINDFIRRYNILKLKNFGSLLSKIKSPNIHGDVTVNYDNIDYARHNIVIDVNSLLYTIYEKEEMSVVSLHSYCPKWIGPDFNITAKASDGVVEAIEYDSKEHFILGVHFHPELEEDNLIFNRLNEEGLKRKRYL